MKAMVLAAGKGERLGRASRGLPKVMLPVAGRPILEHNLLYLKRAGVRDVIVNLHHEPDAIRSFLKKRKNFGLAIRFSFESRLLGTAGAVKKVERHLRGAPFLVLYGDNLVDFDLERMSREHRASGAAVTLAVFNPRQTVYSGLAAGLVRTDPRGRISAFVEKRGNARVPADSWASAGVYVVSPAVLPYIPAGSPVDFAHDVFPRLLTLGESLQVLSGASYVLASDTVAALRRTRLLAPRLLAGGKKALLQGQA